MCAAHLRTCPALWEAGASRQAFPGRSPGTRKILAATEVPGAANLILTESQSSIIVIVYVVRGLR
jgi:hypothetical protein